MSDATDTQPSANATTPNKVVMMGPVIVGLFIALAFMSIFIWAFHDPKPTDLPIGTSGPEASISAVEKAVDDNFGDALDVERVDSLADATKAVGKRELFAAFVIPEDTTEPPSLVIAGANGAAANAPLEGLFNQAAASANLPLVTVDVVPLGEYDTRGLSPFYVVFGVVLGAFLFGVVAFQLGDLPFGARLIQLAVFSLLVGLIVVLVSGYLMPVFENNPWQVGGLTTLLALAVSLTTVALTKLFKGAGIALAALLMLMIGNASTGGAFPYHYLPDGLRDIAPYLPPSVTLDAVIRIEYFGAEEITRQVVVLVVWAVAAAALLMVGSRPSAAQVDADVDATASEASDDDARAATVAGTTD